MQRKRRNMLPEDKCVKQPRPIARQPVTATNPSSVISRLIFPRKLPQSPGQHRKPRGIPPPRLSSSADLTCRPCKLYPFCTPSTSPNINTITPSQNKQPPHQTPPPPRTNKKQPVSRPPPQPHPALPQNHGHKPDNGQFQGHSTV